jgi:hypothetical protein
VKAGDLAEMARLEPEVRAFQAQLAADAAAPNDYDREVADDWSAADSDGLE